MLRLPALIRRILVLAESLRERAAQRSKRWGGTAREPEACLLHMLLQAPAARLPPTARSKAAAAHTAAGWHITSPGPVSEAADCLTARGDGELRRPSTAHAPHRVAALPPIK